MMTTQDHATQRLNRDLDALRIALIRNHLGFEAIPPDIREPLISATLTGLHLEAEATGGIATDHHVPGQEP